MKLLFFRSLWGIPISFKESSDQKCYWDQVLSFVKESGFDGIEASLGDLGALTSPSPDAVIPPRFDPLLLEKYSLKIIIGIYTCWQDYEPEEWDFDRATVDSTLDRYRKQLQVALDLFSKSNIFKINVHSGCGE